MLLLSFSLLAQSQLSFRLDNKITEYIGNSVIECIYNYTVNAPVKDSLDKTRKEIYSTILQTNGTISKFWDWHLFKKDSILFTAEKEPDPNTLYKLKFEYERNIRFIFVPVVLKNYPMDKISVTDNIVPGEYIYEEKKVNRNWILSEDTMTVCGYICNKAVTTFGGREWTAWFTTEISISDGPWKLYGLPGLILKATDKTETHSFEAVTIRKSECPIYISKSSMRQKVKKDVFLKSKADFESDADHNLKKLALLENKALVTYNGSNARYYNNLRCSTSNETIYCPLELK